MNPDDVTIPWCSPGYGTSGATRNGKVAVPDPRKPGGGALSSGPDERQAFVAKVQAMAPYSLNAWAAALIGCKLTARQVRTELPWQGLVVLPEPDSAIAETAVALATSRAIQSG